jgi:hypothetical protein
VSHKRRSVSLKIAVADSDKARFWAKVGSGAPDACWPWLASLWGSGYGQFRLSGPGSQAKQVTVGAHVVAYFIATGVDPVGQEVCHSCDTPTCCNPAHLFLGDRTANMQDAASKGRLSVPRPRRHKIPAQDIPGIRHEIAIGPRGTAARIARARGVTEAHISQLVHGTARQYDAPLAPRLVRKAS